MTKYCELQSYYVTKDKCTFNNILPIKLWVKNKYRKIICICYTFYQLSADYSKLIAHIPWIGKFSSQNCWLSFTSQREMKKKNLSHQKKKNQFHVKSQVFFFLSRMYYLRKSLLFIDRFVPHWISFMFFEVSIFYS